jgi:hypothetical protein
MVSAWLGGHESPAPLHTESARVYPSAGAATSRTADDEFAARVFQTIRITFKHPPDRYFLLLLSVVVWRGIHVERTTRS